MDIKRQKFLILGVSKSGFSCANFIIGKGGACHLYEDNKTDKIKSKIDELTALGAIDLSNAEFEDIFKGVSAVVVSPGVPINHKICIEAKRRGVRILSELEFGFLSFNPLSVAVTGTNGKTTTVSLIEHILKSANINAVSVGNIGYPVTSKLDEILSSSVCVTEVSSFQLESTYKFAPHIACILNITPDHLDRHYTMDNYVYLKKRILQNLTSTEYAVLNYDDERIREFAKDITAKIIPVSLINDYGGASVLGGKLYFKGKFVVDIDELPIKGLHNAQNTLFAIAVCSILGVNIEDIKSGVCSFNGVAHRTELVLEKDGVKYINDSKATNTASSITAINSMTLPTILLLGGSEKGESYLELFRTIKSSVVKHAILYGASRINMISDAGKIGYGDMTIVKNFDDAVGIAKTLAKDGEVVLLSPACASFDEFSGYEERGERFKFLVGAES